MKKTYAVLGGGGSFGLHTSKYLLDHADPAKVIAVGRNLPKDECFTLGIGDGDPRYSYHAYHVNYELDLLMELLDREKPQVIINFAAQGEGATSLKHSWRYFETNCVALVKLTEQLQSRDYLERFIQIGTSELYGSVEHAAKEDEPIKPTSPYAASKAAVAALETSMKLRQGGDSIDWFFLAMAHWQLGDKEEARRWYDRAAEWMDKNRAENADLRRFRAEAEELLKIAATQPAPTVAN